MKKLSIVSVVIITFTFISSTVFAQTDDREIVKDRLLELFNLSLESNYTEAASYCVYRGSDESREWKDVCNYEDEEDIKDVKGICNRIKKYLDESIEYSFGEFSTESESEGVWTVWEVIFVKGNNESYKRYFCFLEINGKYAIGDID
jgi:hypothetical protein